MKKSLVALAGLALLAMAGPPAAGEPGPPENRFVISVEHDLWSQWGFEYPVTYVFRLSGVSAGAAVLRRDEASASWTPLERKTSSDFFNGAECVRIDGGDARVYVSVGFHAGNTIELKFVDVESATFDSVAGYYDGRKAAYTLSNDNWGRQQHANPGAAWRGMTDDASDRYQAAVHACRLYRIPVSIAVNSRLAGGDAIWQRMQEELDRGDRSWEPAVHTRTHPCSGKAYAVHGCEWEILGCRDDILAKLSGIPYGQHVFELILPCGYEDTPVRRAARGEFLFVRDWNNGDNPSSADYVPWNREHHYYGIGGFQTKSYDAVLQSRTPAARYYAADVALLNGAFDAVHEAGGIFYAMWHADRYQNSVVYDTRPGREGTSGSTFMQHLAHVAGRRDVWYVANGWLYSYRFAAENAQVTGNRMPAASTNGS